MARAKESKRPVASLKDYKVLRRPLITEKSSVVGGDGSCVVFKVAKKASKTEIKNAIEKVFDYVGDVLDPKKGTGVEDPRI